MLSKISIAIFLILYFFKLPSKSVVSLLFGELSNIDISLPFWVSIPNPDCGIQSDIKTNSIVTVHF